MPVIGLTRRLPPLGRTRVRFSKLLGASTYRHSLSRALGPALGWLFTMSQDGPPLGDPNDDKDFSVPIRLQFSVQDGEGGEDYPPAASAADDRGDALEVRTTCMWIMYSAPV